MLPRIIAQYVVSFGTAVAKALRRAVAEQMRNEGGAAAASASTSAERQQAQEQTRTNIVHGISLHEAIQILNVNKTLDPAEIKKNYDHLFTVNDKANGGSLYLQSKVYRAKERIDHELESREIKPDEVSESTNTKSTDEQSRS